jgi:hypothetical protein
MLLPDGLPPTLIPIAVAAANEGIPVCAIARILRQPAAEVYFTLKDECSRGAVIELPKADWAPASKKDDRQPVAPRLANDEDTMFQCRQHFRLTNLEAGFLVVLLRLERVEKSKLHNIIEQQRATRSQQPNDLEATDEKMVDVMICKLRKKLKALDASFIIATIWGGGYHITPGVKARMLDRLNGVSHASGAAA